MLSIKFILFLNPIIKIKYLQFLFHILFISHQLYLLQINYPLYLISFNILTYLSNYLFTLMVNHLILMPIFIKQILYFPILMLIKMLFLLLLLIFVFLYPKKFNVKNRKSFIFFAAKAYMFNHWSLFMFTYIF